MVPDQSDFHIFSIIDICIIYLFCSRSYHATPSWWLTLPLICPTGSIKSLTIHIIYILPARDHVKKSRGSDYFSTGNGSYSCVILLVSEFQGTTIVFIQTVVFIIKN